MKSLRVFLLIIGIAGKSLHGMGQLGPGHPSRPVYNPNYYSIEDYSTALQDGSAKEVLEESAYPENSSNFEPETEPRKEPSNDSPAPWFNSPIKVYQSPKRNPKKRVIAHTQARCDVCDSLVYNLNLHEKTLTHKNNIKQLLADTGKLLESLNGSSPDDYEFEYLGGIQESDYDDTDVDTTVYNPVAIPWELIKDATSPSKFQLEQFRKRLLRLSKNYSDDENTASEMGSPIKKPLYLFPSPVKTPQKKKRKYSQLLGTKKLYARKMDNTTRKYSFSIISK